MNPATTLTLRDGTKVFVTESPSFCRAAVNAAIDFGTPARQVEFTRWVAITLLRSFSVQAQEVVRIEKNR